MTVEGGLEVTVVEAERVMEVVRMTDVIVVPFVISTRRVLEVIELMVAGMERIEASPAWEAFLSSRCSSSTTFILTFDEPLYSSTSLVAGVVKDGSRPDDCEEVEASLLL